MLSLEFWQRLLATEAPPERLWPVVKAARAAVIQLDDIKSWSGLTESDRAKAFAASPVSEGVEILERDELPMLRNDTEGPVAVFVRGERNALSRPLVGVVGTRRISTYGRSITTHFATELARSGCTVVSGGAIGIDSTAHTSAIEAGGQTVCVLPCGVDIAYPARHRDLFAKIAGHGCLVSPFACGVPEQDHRLLARNRLVAQLCGAMVIIEAPENSGSLHTAEYARELGKPVFVVPGPVSQDTFKGSHALIRAGAVLVDDPAQVLQALGVESRLPRVRDTSDLKEEEQTVLDVLQGLPRSTESIGEETGLSAPAVLAALTMLEIEGIAVRTPEGYALKP